MRNRAKWLKLPQAEIESKKIYHGDMTGRFAYFRCEVMLPKNAHLIADISANSRYRLRVNGKPVLSGPCKGDKHRQHYETVELTEYLGAVIESIDFNRMPHLWKTKNYDASAWIQAENASDVLPTNPLYIAGVMPRFRIPTDDSHQYGG